MSSFPMLRKTINVDKPVFKLADPNSNLRYRLNNSEPDTSIPMPIEQAPIQQSEQPTDQIQQSQPRMNNLSRLISANQPSSIPSQISDDPTPVQKQPKIVGSKNGLPVFEGYEDLKTPNLEETISNIKDEIDHSDDPKATFYDTLKNGDLSQEELEALIHHYSNR